MGKLTMCGASFSLALIVGGVFLGIASPSLIRREFNGSFWPAKYAQRAGNRWTAQMAAAGSTSTTGLGPSTDVVELVNRPDTKTVKIPRLGLGVFQASPREAEAAVKVALKEGYRHVDSASLYRNEAAIGKAVRASGLPREEVFVTTKLWNSDQGYQNTLQAFDRSMKQLDLEYVDLYLVHSPQPSHLRLDTWRAMEEIYKSGKAKSIGVSNYGIHHLQELFGNCTIRPSVNQIELHPFNTREELVAFCEKEGVVLEAYSPLTQGAKLKDRRVVEVAKKYHKSAAQILIKWGLQKNFVVLPKSVKPDRILENSQVYDFELSPSDMKTLDACDEYYVSGWDPTESN